MLLRVLHNYNLRLKRLLSWVFLQGDLHSPPANINVTFIPPTETLSHPSDLSLILLSAGLIRAMGRSFQSIRQGVISIADRRSRLSRQLKHNNRQYGERLVEIAKQHFSEGFVVCDDPLEAVIFSAIVELLRDQDQTEIPSRTHVDP